MTFENDEKFEEEMFFRFEIDPRNFDEFWTELSIASKICIYNRVFLGKV